MGTLFGFFVGYIVGARAGSEAFDEVVQSYRDIRDSPEFASFVQVARHHLVGTVTQVVERLQPREEQLSTIERAMRRAGE